MNYINSIDNINNYIAPIKDRIPKNLENYEYYKLFEFLKTLFSYYSEWASARLANIVDNKDEFNLRLNSSLYQISNNIEIAQLKNILKALQIAFFNPLNKTCIYSILKLFFYQSSSILIQEDFGLITITYNPDELQSFSIVNLIDENNNNLIGENKILQGIDLNLSSFSLQILLDYISVGVKIVLNPLTKTNKH